MIILNDIGHGALHQEGKGPKYATYIDYGEEFQVYFGEPDEKPPQMEFVADERPHLEFYMKPSCSYCKKVISYLKSIGKEIPMKDVGEDQKAAEELFQLGGKRQMPCLFINGKALYGSDEIIAWLEVNQHLY